MNTRGAALNCPKLFGDSFCECSDSDLEVDESEDRDLEVDGLEDNDDDDDDDLTDLIKSLGDVEVSRNVRDPARESCDDPWHGGADPWRTSGSTRARKGMSTDEFGRQFGHFRLTPSLSVTSPLSKTYPFYRDQGDHGIQLIAHHSAERSDVLECSPLCAGGRAGTHLRVHGRPDA